MEWFVFSSSWSLLLIANWLLSSNCLASIVLARYSMKAAGLRCAIGSGFCYFSLSQIKYMHACMHHDNDEVFKKMAR